MKKIAAVYFDAVNAHMYHKTGLLYLGQKITRYLRE
jgi:hypothetical protein